VVVRDFDALGAVVAKLLGRIVDDSVGSQRAYEFGITPVADGRDFGAEMTCKLDGRAPDTSHAGEYAQRTESSDT
jgi:hypothetical protein